MQYTPVILWLHIWFSFDHFMMDEYQNCQDNSNDILIQNFCWIFLTYFQLWVLCALKSKDREKSLDCSSKWNICKYLHSWANICICVQEVAFLCDILHRRNKNCPQIGFKIQNVKSYQFLIVCVYLAPDGKANIQTAQYLSA